MIVFRVIATRRADVNSNGLTRIEADAMDKKMAGT